ncbi:N(4)-(Beta-N-acetylglucosaminyl)-L-asparaginase-like [Glandiceps talaboti]
MDICYSNLALIVLLSCSLGVLSADLPVVLVTWRFPTAILKAMDELGNNRSPIDAIEASINVCELDPQVCSSGIGFGNTVDDTGEPTLDAMIMDGKTHDVGAVGGLRRVKKAITAARYVMDNTRHTLLVGDSASEFAHGFGNLTDETLKTNVSNLKYEEWQNRSCQPNFWANVTPDPTTSCGPFSPVQISNKGEMVGLDKDNHDTIGMVIIDRNRDVAVGTSTNGLSFKIKGRVGDSPIVGSGSYADNDVGGAAATGNGDIMMRFMPSYQTVENMRQGMSPSEAAAEALGRIAYRFKDFGGAVVAANKQGEVGGACYSKSGGRGEFTYMTGSMTTVAVVEMECIVKGKKGTVYVDNVGAASTVQLNKFLLVLLALIFYLNI